MWNRVDNVTEYHVQWGQQNASVNLTQTVVGGNNITLRDLLPSRQYGVSVSSLVAGVVKNTSHEVIFTTKPTNSSETSDPIDQMNSMVPKTSTNSMVPENSPDSTVLKNSTNSMVPKNSTDFMDLSRCNGGWYMIIVQSV